MKKIIGVVIASMMFANIGFAETREIEESAIRFGDNYSSSRLQTTCVDGYKFVIVRGPKSISVVQFWEQVRGVPGTASQPAKC